MCKTEPLVFNESILLKTSYKEDIIHSVQHNWQIGAQWQREESAGLTIEKVFTASLKKMFSLSLNYGGHVLKIGAKRNKFVKSLLLPFHQGVCILLAVHTWNWK